MRQKNDIQQVQQQESENSGGSVRQHSGVQPLAGTETACQSAENNASAASGQIRGDPKQTGEKGSVYVVDFVYEECGRTVAEDVKGMRTEVYNLKRKLFKLRYPEIEFREVKV